MYNSQGMKGFIIVCWGFFCCCCYQFIIINMLTDYFTGVHFISSDERDASHLVKDMARSQNKLLYIFMC